MVLFYLWCGQPQHEPMAGKYFVLSTIYTLLYDQKSWAKIGPCTSSQYTWLWAHRSAISNTGWGNTNATLISSAGHPGRWGDHPISLCFYKAISLKDMEVAEMFGSISQFGQWIKKLGVMPQVITNDALFVLEVLLNWKKLWFVRVCIFFYHLPFEVE